jgi:hypothetical protein
LNDSLGLGPTVPFLEGHILLDLGEPILCMHPSAGAILMHLASDYIHPYRSAGGRHAQCRVRIYLPDAPVVICSELPSNSGGSVTNSAEVIAAEVIHSHELPTPLVWIEHWPEAETFELVVFSNYEVEERAP